MRIIVTRWLILLIASVHFSVQSQWYEASGYAYVTHQGKEQARTQAIENALKKALLVAGASVSSAQQVVNGLLTQDEISIRASGTVSSFELLEETHADKIVTVTIRADIFPEEKKCFSTDYRKSLLLTKSHLVQREQANVGKVYSLDKEVIQRLASKIHKSGQYLDTVLALKNKTNFSRLNNSLQAESIKNLTMTLADTTNTQFVLYSELDDLSLQYADTNPLVFWKNDKPNRQFNFSIYIYNGANGELLLQKQYENSAIWPYDKRAEVDITSADFWTSSYGNMIDYTLDNLLTDIDENMMCQSTRGKVVHIENGVLTINLGKKHGVQVGDKFTLLHLNNFITNSGRTYAGYNVSDFTVEVTQVSQNTSRAVSDDESMFSNIQINDLAVSY